MLLAASPSKARVQPSALPSVVLNSSGTFRHESEPQSVVPLDGMCDHLRVEVTVVSGSRSQNDWRTVVLPGVNCGGIPAVDTTVRGRIGSLDGGTGTTSAFTNEPRAG